MTDETKQKQAEIRVVKKAACPSISGKSTLSYEVGATVEGKIQLRLHANTGSGHFDRQWTSFERIQQALAKVPAGKPITSSVLHPLFRGQSINTPSFIFAVLKAERLVAPCKDASRQYDRLDPEPFLTEMKALIASPEAPKAAAKQKEVEPEKAKAAKARDGAPESGRAAAKEKPAGTEKRASGAKKKAASKSTKK